MQPADGSLTRPMTSKGETNREGAVTPKTGGQAGGGIGQCGQAIKGVWGMSWRQEAKKGVEDCEKPGGAVKRALMPGYPNERVLNP